VLGRPITHSLSPLLHRAAYTALGLAWSYEAVECDEVALPEVLAARTDWAGFSCTMPLKRAVVAIADEVRPLAAAAGAGNTLLPRDGGGWIADNTDVLGLVAAVHEHGLAPSSVTVLGAGGTAQATVVALAQLGISQCTVLARDPARARAVQATAQAVGVAAEFADLEPGAPALAAGLVISTLPAGAADPLADARWRPGQAVLDVIYEPWPTALAAAAAGCGAVVLGGAVLLLHQAAAQVQLMTGRAAPVEAMRAALRTVRPDV
jgi:shikimate dehydrogenase